MPTQAIGWLAHPIVESLFRDFPLPLAVAEHGALRAVNARFFERFDDRSLRSEALQRLLRSPHAGWEPVALTQRDGTEVKARAQTLRVDAATMLVIDEALDDGSKEVVAFLHARVLELEHESSTDRLTGAWNRAHLDRVVASEIARSTHFRLPISLILVDIDHFKRVNDVHGHQAGDAVLRHLVELMKRRVRAADPVFRWGGEELVVLASTAGYRAAERIAEALRAAVESEPFPFVDRLTISAGVAEHLLGEDADAWFARADAVLYAAKAGGRNCVHVDRTGSSDLWSASGREPVLRLDWQEAYECGEPTIDAEHRQLFALANALLAASVDPQASPAASLAAMDELIAHVVTHFADEEAVLERRGYTRLDVHREAHTKLRARALKLREELAAGRARLGDVVDFLVVQVVAKHLLTADRDFYPLFTP